jgi:hypothetical protein
VRILRPLTIAGLLLISACYQQPVISPQRPLRCTPNETRSECPKGLTCVLGGCAPGTRLTCVPTGVCAPNSCQKDQDCPVGLACSSRGCVALPDGGAGDSAIQIPVLPDAGPFLDAPPVLDAPPPPPDVPAFLPPDGGNG